MNVSRRYSVRERSTTRDARGEKSDIYAHKFYIWGEPPREGTTAIFSDVGALRSEETFRLRTRWRSNINVGDQLVDSASGSTLYLRSIADVDGRRRWLQLVATQRPALGT